MHVPCAVLACTVVYDLSVSRVPYVVITSGLFVADGSDTLARLPLRHPLGHRKVQQVCVIGSPMLLSGIQGFSALSWLVVEKLIHGLQTFGSHDGTEGTT